MTSVYVFGSVASGHVDEKSDVDIGIVCQPGVLASSTRRDLLSAISPDWTINYMHEADPNKAIWETYDKGNVGGVWVEVHYLTVAKLSNVLEQVVSQGAITTDAVLFRPYRLGSMVQRAWLLRDKRGVFKRWQVSELRGVLFETRSVQSVCLELLTDDVTDLFEDVSGKCHATHFTT